MSPSLSVSRASTLVPSAQLQAQRAARRAEGDASLLVSLAEAARDITCLVAQSNADAAQLHGRLRAYDALRSASGQAVEAARLTASLTGHEHNAEALAEALATLKQDIAHLQVSGPQAAQQHALGQQVADDQGDVDGIRADLAAVREALSQRDGFVLGRKEALAALPRAQDAAGELAGSQAHQALAQQALAHADADAAAERPVAEPPSWLLPQLGGFVQAWNDICRDPRELAKPQQPGKPTDGRVAGLQARWTAFHLKSNVQKHMDPNEMTQWVMQQAYRDNTQDLRSYAMRLEFHTAIKSRLRDELNRARLWRSEHPPKAGDTTLAEPFKKTVVPLDPHIDAEGNWNLRDTQEGEEVASADALQDYIREMEQSLQTVGDDMQMAQIELQMMSQRQQQLLNVLSNLSKAQHETSMAILRKIGT